MAKLCLSVWMVAFFGIPDFFNALLMAFCNAREVIWCLLIIFARGSRLIFFDGNTYCHAHSFEAFGNFFASAFGRRKNENNRGKISAYHG